jgi:hypothetical protein
MTETILPSLHIELNVNQYLTVGARRLDASFIITPQGFGAPSTMPVPRFLAVIVDSSGSMGGGKIVAAKKAACADFLQALRAVQSHTLSNVRVQLWMPEMVRLIACKQIAPAIIDLMDSITQDADGLTHRIQTGAWNNEPREYYVAFEMEPWPTGKRMCAGLLSLTYTFGGQECTVPTPPLRVLAEWTEDVGKSARIPMGVARATNAVELATAIQEGVQAYQENKPELATAKLGRAVQIAHETGNEAMTARLQGIVDIVDARQGTVRMKPNARKLDLMKVDLESTKHKVIRSIAAMSPTTKIAMSPTTKISPGEPGPYKGK